MKKNFCLSVKAKGEKNKGGAKPKPTGAREEKKYIRSRGTERLSSERVRKVMRKSPQAGRVLFKRGKRLYQEGKERLANPGWPIPRLQTGIRTRKGMGDREVLNDGKGDNLAFYAEKVGGSEIRPIWVGGERFENKRKVSGVAIVNWNRSLAEWRGEL